MKLFINPKDLKKHKMGETQYSCYLCKPYNVKATDALFIIYAAIYVLLAIVMPLLGGDIFTIIMTLVGLFVTGVFIYNIKSTITNMLARKAGVLFCNPSNALENRLRLGYLGKLSEDDVRLLLAYTEENCAAWFGVPADVVQDAYTQCDLLMGTVVDTRKAKHGEQQVLEVEFCGRKGHTCMLTHVWNGKKYEKGDSIHLVYFAPLQKGATAEARIIDIETLHKGKWARSVIGLGA